MNEQTSYERHIIELETIQRAKCMQNLYDKNKQLQEEAIFRETLLDMVWSKNKKLEQKVEELEAEIRQLRNENCNLGFDLGYDEAILDGSWPQAIEILEKALKNAKLRNKGE